jgi:hypothetical protein
MTHQVAREKRAEPGDAMDHAGSGEIVVFVEAGVGLTGTETGMPR